MSHTPCHAPGPSGRSLTPSLVFPAALRQAAQGIRAAIFDVDGVLTDGGLYFSESGETLKRFNTLDGHGIKLLQRAGIVPAVIAPFVVIGLVLIAAELVGKKKTWNF